MTKDIINIGLLTPYLEGFYFGGFINSIHDATKKEGARLIVIKTSVQKLPSENIKYNYPLAFEQVDGWIILPQGTNKEYLDYLSGLGKPIMMLSREFENNHCYYTLPDEFYCIKSATEHLINHGHKKIAFVHCFDIHEIYERYEGYLEALKEKDIPLDSELVFNVSNALQSGGYEAAQKLIDLHMPCTAIIASTDFNALGMMEKFLEAGYHIPEDVAIIGCDDTEHAKTSTPPLSSVRQNLYDVGFKAAENLIETVRNGKKASSDNKFYIQSDLILRNSCGCNPDKPVSDQAYADLNNNANVKLINYMGNMLINNYIIGNNLIKENSNVIKTLSWLSSTNFHWACLGLWSKKDEYLIVDQYYNSKEKLSSPLGIQCPIEAFPPVQYLPDSTHSGGDDIIWLHPIRTEVREWGFLALVGPIDKMQLLIHFDTMSLSFNLLAVALEREAMSENHYRSLLDNVGQGFLSFGEDLLIDDEYSCECKRIFNSDIANLSFPELISTNNPDQRRFLENIFYDLMHETNEKKSNLLLGLLPNEFIVNKRNIQVQYKLVEDYTLKMHKKIVLILTDITDKRNLESEVEYERNILKMVVKSVVDHNEFVDVVKDFEQFYQITLKKLLESKKSLIEIVSKIVRLIHTFKGNFSQLDMVKIVEKLNTLEIEVSEVKIHIDDYSKQKFSDFMLQQGMEKWLEDDLKVLKEIMGERYFSMDSIVMISETKIKEIEKKVIFTFSASECRVILPELRKLLYKPFKDLLRTYIDYTSKLAQRLKKSVQPIEIKGGEEILVSSEKYNGFIKSLVHVFRNAADHGIELPDERLECGKSEFGIINCIVEYKNHHIHLIIEDDGKGIDLEKIRCKLIEKGIHSNKSIKGLSEKQVIEYIFKDDITTNDRVNDLSGRGVGLAAVKYETDQLGGTVRVTSEKGKGTRFEFIIPHINIEDLVKASILNAANIVLHKTKEFFHKNYSFHLNHCSKLNTEKNQKIVLHDLTSTINMRGLINGKFILSVDEKMARSMVRSFMLEKLTYRKEADSMEGVLLEFTNIILGNSIEHFGDLEEFLIMDTPITIYSKGGLLKYPKTQVKTLHLEFEEGSLTAGFVSSK